MANIYTSLKVLTFQSHCLFHYDMSVQYIFSMNSYYNRLKAWHEDHKKQIEETFKGWTEEEDRRFIEWYSNGSHLGQPPPPYAKIFSETPPPPPINLSTCYVEGDGEEGCLLTEYIEKKIQKALEEERKKV